MDFTRPIVKQSNKKQSPDKELYENQTLELIKIIFPRQYFSKKYIIEVLDFVKFYYYFIDMK